LIILFFIENIKMGLIIDRHGDASPPPTLPCDIT